MLHALQNVSLGFGVSRVLLIPDDGRLLQDFHRVNRVLVRPAGNLPDLKDCENEESNRLKAFLFVIQRIKPELFDTSLYQFLYRLYIRCCAVSLLNSAYFLFKPFFFFWCENLIIISFSCRMGTTSVFS